MGNSNVVRSRSYHCNHWAAGYWNELSIVSDERVCPRDTGILYCGYFRRLLAQHNACQYHLPVQTQGENRDLSLLSIDNNSHGDSVRVEFEQSVEFIYLH